MVRALSTCTLAGRCLQAVLQGHGSHQGVDVAWTLRARADGAFHDQLASKVLTSRLGYSGTPDFTCWEVRLLIMILLYVAPQLFIAAVLTMRWPYSVPEPCISDVAVDPKLHLRY